MKITYNTYFLAPDLQRHMLYQDDQRQDLGLEPSAFRSLPPPPPWPEGGLKAVVLVMRLPDRYGKSGFERTVEEYWRRLSWPVVGSGGRMARMPDLRFDAAHLVDLNGPRKPGLYWAVLDLAASWWPKSCCSPHQGALLSLSEGQTSLAGVEVLAAAAMHRDWLMAMDGTSVPSVWLNGLLLKIDGLDHKQTPYTPALSYRRDEKTVSFTAGHSHASHPQFAVPRLLSCVSAKT